MKGGMAAVIALVVVVRVGVVVASWEGCALLAGRGIMAFCAVQAGTLAQPWDTGITPEPKCRLASFSVYSNGPLENVED
jgi:hypothetical protein